MTSICVYSSGCVDFRATDNFKTYHRGLFTCKHKSFLSVIRSFCFCTIIRVRILLINFGKKEYVQRKEILNMVNVFIILYV